MMQLQMILNVIREIILLTFNYNCLELIFLVWIIIFDIVSKFNVNFITIIYRNY